MGQHDTDHVLVIKCPFSEVTMNDSTYKDSVIFTNVNRVSYACENKARLTLLTYSTMDTTGHVRKPSN